jgi:hypothetical protein
LPTISFWKIQPNHVDGDEELLAEQNLLVFAARDLRFIQQCAWPNLLPPTSYKEELPPLSCEKNEAVRVSA